MSPITRKSYITSLFPPVAALFDLEQLFELLHLFVVGAEVLGER
jgi:hypothetical protein